VFLPDLLCELAAAASDSKGLPLAVVEAEKEFSFSSAEAELGKKELAAVSEPARRFGVRSGQTVAEARALLANLVVRGVTPARVHRALGSVAEVLMVFGATVSIEPPDESTPFDTVLVDLTGSAHLHGGEEAALFEMAERVRELGHRVRAAIADGPRLSRAAAAFAGEGETIVAVGDAAPLMQSLPLHVLPLRRDRIVWLNRLGLFTVGDLVKLPRETLCHRLGENCELALDLALGRDNAPLIAYQPPRKPTEEVSWEESVTSIEPLLFALRGLSSRLSVRLEGRGEAAHALELLGPYDASVARLQGIDTAKEPGLSFRIDLPSALSHKSDLFRVLKSKLEHTHLRAPVTGLRVVAAELTVAPKMQLSLDGDASEQADPRKVAVLLAELSAEIGKDNVGVLELVPVHRPEARTKLAPLDDVTSSPSFAKLAELCSEPELPVRILAKPVPFTFMPGGSMVSVSGQLFTMKETSHFVRFDQVEWWTPAPVCRDYARVWLTAGKKNVEAWVFIDRLSRKTFLHGYFD
jgi:protein ImuB